MRCRYCGKLIWRLLVDREYCCEDHRKKYHEHLVRALEQVLKPPDGPPSIADFRLNMPSTARAPSDIEIVGDSNPLIMALPSIRLPGSNAVVPPGAVLRSRAAVLFSAPAFVAGPPFRSKPVSGALMALTGRTPRISPLPPLRSLALAGALELRLPPEVPHPCTGLAAEALEGASDLAYSHVLVVPSAAHPVAPVRSLAPASAMPQRVLRAPTQGVFVRSRLEWLPVSLSAPVSRFHDSFSVPRVAADSHGFIFEDAPCAYARRLQPQAPVPHPLAAAALMAPLCCDRNPVGLGLPPPPGLCASAAPTLHSPEPRRPPALMPLQGINGPQHSYRGELLSFTASSALAICRPPTGGGIAHYPSFFFATRPPLPATGSEQATIPVCASRSRFPEIPGVPAPFGASRGSLSVDPGYAEALASHVPVSIPGPLTAATVTLPAVFQGHQCHGLRPAAAVEPRAPATPATPGRGIALGPSVLRTSRRLSSAQPAGLLAVARRAALPGQGLIPAVPPAPAGRAGTEFVRRLATTSNGAQMGSGSGPSLPAFSRQLPSPAQFASYPFVVFRLALNPAATRFSPLFAPAETVNSICYLGCALLLRPARTKPLWCASFAAAPRLVSRRAWSAVQETAGGDSEFLPVARAVTYASCLAVDRVSPGFELAVRAIHSAPVAQVRGSLTKCAAAWAGAEHVAVLPACSMRLWPPCFEQLALQGAAESRRSGPGLGFAIGWIRGTLTRYVRPAMGHWKSLAAGAALVTVLGTAAYHLRSGEFLQSERASFGRMVRERAAIELSDTFRPGFALWEGERDWARRWSYDKDGFIRAGELALYRPSLALSDYRMEFLTQVERRSVGFVVRARDLRNYYAMKLTVVKPGLQPELALVRYSVINGIRGPSVRIPVRTIIDGRMPYPVRVEVNGNQFSALVRDELIDVWSDDELPRGGVGLFAETGERARIYWMRLSSHTDSLGRLCALLAGNGAAEAANGGREAKE